MGFAVDALRTDITGTFPFEHDRLQESILPTEANLKRCTRTLSFLVLVFFGLSFDGLAQNRYLTTGTGGTPMALSGDYRSLGWNPGHLTFSPLLEDQLEICSGWYLKSAHALVHLFWKERTYGTAYGAEQMEKRMHGTPMNGVTT